jgi:tetratricopeptide (TPR) repeat protein
VSEFGKALDRDDVPIRIGSRQRQILHQVAAHEKTLFADAWTLFASVSPHGIVGSELLWDYCHPDITGHQYVAALACSVLVASRILPPPVPGAPDLLSRPVTGVSLASLGFATPDSVSLANLPRGADGLWWLGNCAQRQGRADQAKEWFTRSLEADPNHPGALIGLAISRSQEGRHDEAISMGQRAVAAYERAGLTPLVARSRYELAVFYTRAGRLQDAAQELRRVLAINPAYPGAHKTLGRALVDLKDFAGAEKTLQEGIKVFANEPGLHKELARAYRIQNRSDDAIDQYREEERIAPGDPGTHFLLGELYRQAGRNNEAIAEWEIVLNLDPGEEEAVVALARLCLATGKKDEARQALSRFLKDHRAGAEIAALQREIGD